MSFALHPQLAADSIVIGDLPLCRVLLMNNRHFPWLILVPMRVVMREIYQLDPEDYRQMMQEVRFVAEHMQEYTGAHKMNIAALGNMVPQLHMHVIARFNDDAAWPSPVWSATVNPEPYSQGEIVKIVADMARALGLSNITKM